MEKIKSKKQIHKKKLNKITKIKSTKIKTEKGITLLALVITIVLNFSYLEMARMNKFEKI